MHQRGYLSQKGERGGIKDFLLKRAATSLHRLQKASLVHPHPAKSPHVQISAKQKASLVQIPPNKKGPLVQRGLSQSDWGIVPDILPICRLFKMIAKQSLTRYAGAPFAQGSLLRIVLC